MYVFQCAAVRAAVVIIEEHGLGFGNNEVQCFWKKAHLISCMSEINVKQCNNDGREYSRQFFFCQCFYMVRLVKNKFPKEQMDCDLKAALYLTRMLSNVACQVVLQHLSLHPLGQVSYCQDCSLNTQPYTHTHTYTDMLRVIHYCACQPSVQSILPLQQHAHM